MIQHQLDARIERILSDIDGMLAVTKNPVELFRIDASGRRIPTANGSLWGKDPWQNFEVYLQTEPAPVGYQNYLYLTTGREGQWDACNPQFEARINGRLMQAFDVNHVRMPLDSCGDVCVALEGCCLRSEMEISQPFVYAELRVINTELEQLSFDIRVPYEAAILLQEGEREREMTLKLLSDAINLIDFRRPHTPAFDKSIQEARHYLQENYYQKRRALPPVAVADSIGHTHIDVAWLWDLEQTRHKAARSFSTVCALMDRYPEYQFMSSQPILYDFVKQDEPELYERIKQRIREGRWEVEGGMWVEADCNLSGGEALARQFLYGQRFFEKEFGKRCRVLWLPDVFGYSAALPQMMRLCGIEYFMTTKISWNEYNAMPYDTFRWKGIDGTCVLTHFSPVRDFYSTNMDDGNNRHNDFYTTYTSMMNASEIAGGWKRFLQKGIDDHFLVLYGYGDGGGGPTMQMLERARRMATPMPLTPVVKQEFVQPFFEKLDQRVGNNPQLPVWSGELYLEYHRGTYTSQAKTKRNNRKAEIALRCAELRCVQAGNTPKKVLDEVWKDVLTLQFHDILPGSSIHKVYEDADRMYAGCFQKLEELQQQACSTLTQKQDGTICVFNDLGFERDDVLCFDCDNPATSLLDDFGRRFPVQKFGTHYVAYVRGLPPLSASNFTLEQKAGTYSTIRLDRNGFETPFYFGVFDSAMRITSLVDKRCGRELCKDGKALNRLVCYENKPHNYDAWDINIYYDCKSWEIDDVSEVRVLGCGNVMAGIRIVRKYMSSTVQQDILFYADSPRIDFRTEANWNEQTYVVKAHFPLDIFHTSATYDIQYGNVSRPTCKNTSWDVARFEVCAHKWVDLSEPEYGVALLNDCKYGHSVSDDELSLTLWKTSCYPDETADIGDHVFTYALYPHIGDWRQGKVIDEAYKLNMPLQAIVGVQARSTCSLAKQEGTGAVIEAIKQSEDGKGIVMRLYECFGGRRTISIQPGFAFKKVCIVNILEEIQDDACVADGKVTLTLKPYQIVTLKFTEISE